MNSACNFLQMSLTKPSFSSQIPQHLLSEANDRDKYILESLSVITQNNNWLIEETVKQSAKLEEQGKQLNVISEQTTRTNGRVTKLELKNENDGEQDIQVKQIVAFKQFCQKYLLNKYALIGFGALILGFLKIITTPELRELFLKLVGFA